MFSCKLGLISDFNKLRNRFEPYQIKNKIITKPKSNRFSFFLAIITNQNQVNICLSPNDGESDGLSRNRPSLCHQFPPSRPLSGERLPLSSSHEPPQLLPRRCFNDRQASSDNENRGQEERKRPQRYSIRARSRRLHDLTRILSPQEAPLLVFRRSRVSSGPSFDLDGLHLLFLLKASLCFDLGQSGCVLCVGPGFVRWED